MNFRVTTSLAVLGMMLSSPLVAQENEWDVKIGGYIEQFSAYSSPGSVGICADDFDDVDIISEQEIVFRPSITLDNGITINADVDFDRPPPKNRRVLILVTDELNNLVITTGRNPGSDCRDIAQNALDLMINRFDGDELSALDELEGKLADLEEALKLFSDGSIGWQSIDGMRQVVAAQIEDLRPPAETVVDLDLKWEMKLYPIGGVSRTRFGNFQDTTEDYSFGGGLRVSKEVWTEDDLSVDFGFNFTSFATSNQEVINRVAPFGRGRIGEGSSVKVLALGPAFGYRPVDWLYLQAMAGLAEHSTTTSFPSSEILSCRTTGSVRRSSSGLAPMSVSTTASISAARSTGSAGTDPGSISLTAGSRFGGVGKSPGWQALAC